MTHHIGSRFLTVLLITLGCLLALLASTNAARAFANASSAVQQSAAVDAFPAAAHRLANARALALQTGTVITATKRDELVDDADGSGTAGPGDTLRYTIVVRNVGSLAATDLLVSDTLPEGLTLAGDVLVSPIAGDDSYDVLGNTVINIDAAGGLLANDIDPDGGAITATAVVTAFTVEGGDITVNEDGSFSYDPPAGFSGTDWFEYSISDEDGLSASGTIQFIVDTVIWYVDETAEEGGDGRLSAPLRSAVDAQSAADAGEIIFLYAGAYSADLTLADNQMVIGQGVDLAGSAGLTVPAGAVLPGATISPTLSGSMTAAKNNAVHGLVIDNGGGTALTGNSFERLTVRSAAISGAGRALQLTNGEVDAIFDSVSSLDSDAEGIYLSDLSGLLMMNGGAIGGAAGDGISISASSATILYDGAISNGSSGAYAVLLSGNEGASISLNGDISSSGSGVRGLLFSDNDNSTIFLHGTLTLNTGSNPALVATGGGALHATAPDNVITTAGVTAITIDNVTIGEQGVHLKQVSASGAARGIVLNNAGSGGFTVSGGEGTYAGGALLNITQRAIEVINTDNVSFSGMLLNNANTSDAGGTGVCDTLYTSGCHAAIYLRDVTNATFENIDVSGTIAEQGINGLDVSGFTLRNSAISGCGDAAGEGCVKMRNLTGTATFDSVTLSFAAEKVVEIHNDSGELTLNVLGSTIGDTQTSVTGADGLEVVLSAAAEATVTVDGSAFTRNRTNGLQIVAQGSSSASLNVTNSTFDAGSGVGKGLDLATTNTATLDFNVVGNPTIHSSGGHAITVAAFDASSMQGRIKDNDDIQTGGLNTPGSGIAVQVNDGADGIFEISDNTIRNIGIDSGIYLVARPDRLSSAQGRLDATLHNNDVTVAGVEALFDFDLNAHGANTLCANLTDNTASGNGSGALYVREVSPGTVLLQGFSGDAAGTWSANGNSGAGVIESPANAASGGTCRQPTHALASAESPAMAAATPASPPPAKLGGAMAGTMAMATAANERGARELTPAQFAAPARLAASPALQTMGEISVGPFDLPAGKSVTVQFDVTIADPFPAGASQVENQAQVSGANFATVLSDDPDSSAPGDATTTLLDAAYDLTLTKSDGGISAEPGDTVVYTLTAGNGGNQHAANVVISETVPAHSAFNAAASSAGWSCADGAAAGSECVLALGAVEAGAVPLSRLFAVDVAAPLPAGVEALSNIAEVAVSGASADDAQPADNVASENTPLAAQPDLQLTMQAESGGAVPGGVITYTLHYTNTGNQGATGVVIEGVVPATTSFNAAASSAGWSCAPDGGAGALCSFNVGPLAGDAAGATTFVVTVDNPAPAGVESIVNSARIVDDGSNGAEPDETDNEATTTTALDAAPALALEKSDGGANPRSGETLVYTLTLRNSGNQGVSGVVLTETVPAHSSFNAAGSDGGWSCAPDGSAASVCTLAPGGELSGGGEVEALFAVDIVDSLPSGVTALENRAQASGDGVDVALSDDPDTVEAGDATVTALDVRADISITKTDNVTRTVAGEPIRYEIVVTNLGPDAVAGANIIDEMSSSLLNATWQCEEAHGAACGAASGTGDIGELIDLPMGGVVTYVIEATVAPDRRGTLRNTAFVLLPRGVTDPTPGNNSAADDTEVLGEVRLSLEMSGPADAVVAGSGGGNLQYTLTVTNHGPSLATGVTIAHAMTLPPGVQLDGVSFDSSNGSFVTNFWTVNALDVGSSETLTLTLTVGPDAAAGVDVIEIAALITAAAETIRDSSEVNATESSTVARSVDVQLAASAAPPVVTAGSGTGNLTFVITATNAGPSNASGVAISNTLTLPTGVWEQSVTASTGTTYESSHNSWLVGELAPGAQATLTVLVTVGPEALTGVDVVSSEATLEAVNEPDSDGSNDSAVASSSIGALADLTVTLDSSHDPVTAGTVMSYTVLVTNNGPSDAQNVAVSATLDAALSHLRSEGCDEDPDGATMCSVGLIEAGATAIITQTVLVDGAASGSLSSSVAVSSDATEGNPGDETASEVTGISVSADLSVYLSATPEPALAGYPITYTVTVTNAGPSRAIDPAVQITLAPALTLQSTDCADAFDSGYLDGGDIVVCEVLATFAAATSGLQQTTATVTATTADPVAANNSFTHGVMLYDNRFTIGDVQAAEGDSGLTAFTFTITRTSNVTASAVDVATVAGTAAEDDDFAPLATTVSFTPGGSLTQTVTVNVVGDALVELDETFTVQLSNAVNGAIEVGEGQGTILNDDSAVVTMGDAQLLEGDAGSSAMIFTATLSAAVENGVSIDYVTVDDTAEDENGDGDYLATAGSLTFAGAAGEQQTITVQVQGDTVMEPDERFFVQLSNLDAQGRAVTLDAAQATGTVLNDDEALISFDQNAYIAGEGDGALAISVTLSIPASYTITVDYESQDGSARANEDYTPISGTLTFAPGETALGLTLALLDDDLDEDDETLLLWLRNPSAGALDTDNLPATVVIVDDDGEPTIGFTAFTYDAVESDPGAVISVTLSHVSGRDVSVAVNSEDRTAIAGEDYSVVSETLTIPAGQRVVTFTVPLLDDALYEEDETVVLTLSNALNATLGAVNPATLLIEDDDSAPLVSFEAAEFSVREGGGALLVAVQLDRPSGRDVQVAVSSADGTALAGEDYEAFDQMLTIPAGQQVVTFTLSILDDAVVEEDKTFTLSLHSAVGAAIGANSTATVTIVDDDTEEPPVYFYWFPVVVKQASMPASATHFPRR